MLHFVNFIFTKSKKGERKKVENRKEGRKEERKEGRKKKDICYSNIFLKNVSGCDSSLSLSFSKDCMSRRFGLESVI